MIIDAVYADGDAAAFGDIRAGAADDLVLTDFDAVDNVVARNGIDAQARQTGVDDNLAIAATGVAVLIGDARADG